MELLSSAVWGQRGPVWLWFAIRRLSRFVLARLVVSGSLWLLTWWLCRSVLRSSAALPPSGGETASSTDLQSGPLAFATIMFFGGSVSTCDSSMGFDGIMKHEKSCPDVANARQLTNTRAARPPRASKSKRAACRQRARFGDPGPTQFRHGPSRRKCIEPCSSFCVHWQTTSSSPPPFFQAKQCRTPVDGHACTPPPVGTQAIEWAETCLRRAVVRTMAPNSPSACK